jgi:predicted PurR-regulated permease PerM
MQRLESSGWKAAAGKQRRNETPGPVSRCFVSGMHPRCCAVNRDRPGGSQMPDDMAAPAVPRTQIAPASTPDPSSPLISAVVLVAVLYFGREVLIPITLAILLSFLLAPVVGLLRWIHLGRVPSVLLAVILALGIILALGGLIGTQVAGLAQDLPRYASTVEHKLSTVRSFTVARMSELAGRLGHQVEPADNAPPTTPPSATEPGSQEQKPLPVEIHQPNPSPLALAERFLSPVLSPLGTLGIVLVVAIFILLQQEDLRDRLIRLVGSSDLHRTTVAMDDGARRLSRYFLAQLGVNAGFGCVIGIGLFLIGVPSPVLWGILSGLLRFVPYIGSMLSAVFPVALAAAVDPGWSMALWTLALYLVVEPVVGQVVEPLLYGHSTGLSPVAVVVAAIFWSWLWGPVGLILSTPLTLCLVVLGRHVERLQFLDVLLGDRPALTPIESFYQRILAGDADEAQDHAELLLKDRSLSSYYDEVALKGLQLAANDAQKGVLSDQQLDRIKDTIKGLVGELARYDDADPRPEKSGDGAVAPPRDETELPKNRLPSSIDATAEALPAAWTSETAVLCIAGRGPLDEAGSSMLAQLLQKHGLGARVVPNDAVSRTRVDNLDVQGAAMVCISYLEISGSPSHLRYLLRRLKQRIPGAPILVGLWPAEDAVLKDERLRAAIGADYYTSSLHEAVESCLDAARARSPNAASAEAGR